MVSPSEGRVRVVGVFKLVSYVASIASVSYNGGNLSTDVYWQKLLRVMDAFKGGNPLTDKYTCFVGLLTNKHTKDASVI